LDLIKAVAPPGFYFGKQPNISESQFKRVFGAGIMIPGVSEKWFSETEFPALLRDL
jgi:hypothetical protein